MESCKLPAFADADSKDAVASCVGELLTRVTKQSLEEEENSGITGTPVVSLTKGVESGEGVIGKGREIDERSEDRYDENEKRKEGEEGPFMEQLSLENDDGSKKDQMDMKTAAESMDSEESKNDNNGRSDSSGTIEYDSSSDDNSRRSDVNVGNLEKVPTISNDEGVQVVEEGERDEGRNDSDSDVDDSSVSHSSNSGASSSEREKSQMRSRTPSTPSDKTAGDPDGGIIFGSGGSDYENSSDEFDANEPSTSAAHAERGNWRGEERNGNGGAGGADDESDDSLIMAQLIAHRNQRDEDAMYHRMAETQWYPSPCRRLVFDSDSSDGDVAGDVQNAEAAGLVEDAGMAGNAEEPETVQNSIPSPTILNVRRAQSLQDFRRNKWREEGKIPRKARSLGKRTSNMRDMEAELADLKRARVHVPEAPQMDNENGRRNDEIDQQADEEAARIRRNMVLEMDIRLMIVEMEELRIEDVAAAVGDVDNSDDDGSSLATSLHTAIELRRSSRIKNPIVRWGYDHPIVRRRGPRRGGVQKRKTARRPRRRLAQVPAIPAPPPVPRPVPFLMRQLAPLPPAPVPIIPAPTVVLDVDDILEELADLEATYANFDFGSDGLDIVLQLRRLQNALKKFEQTPPSDAQKLRLSNGLAKLKGLMGVQ